MENFYKTIRPIRMLKGKKQEEIALLLNVKQQSISKIEIGLININAETANKIANHFGFEDKDEMIRFYDTLTK